MSQPSLKGNDRGATMFMVAFTLMVLLGVSAIAVDLSAVRADRSTDQKVTDSAAASGALAALEGAGREACEGALAYIAINTPAIGPVDDSGCAISFSATCIPNRPETHTVVLGRHTITITYPVPDTHELMTSGLLGASGQALVTSDGIPCERVGVHMESTHDSFFAQLLGFNQSSTNVHTVATVTLPSRGGVPINLLVLNRTSCQTIVVSGNGGVIVDAIIDPDGGGPGVPGLLQGIVASDSDGSAGCTNSGVIDISGGNSVLRADGPAGCPNQTSTQVVGPSLLKGLGCGLVMTLAPGTPGCNAPACTVGGGGNAPNPLPTALPGRLTRAPVDYRYNCQPDYTTLNSSLSWATTPLTAANGQDIPGCTEPPAPYIHELISSVGQSGMPSGFQPWSPTYSCNLPSSADPIDVSGNWWINCSGGGGFSVSSQVTIRGNVVFDGKVSVGAGGHLSVQNTLANPGYAFLRNGELSKAGQGSLTFLYTMVYASRTSSVKLVGGSGSLVWVAPDLEGYKFDDLALWSDSPLSHSWAGQANLQMEGVFFSPRATAEYSGGAGQNTAKAQWIADRLVATGQGVLHVRPEFGRHVDFPVPPQTILIR